GELTIKGVTLRLDEPVMINRTSGETEAICEFIVRPADYGIKIPRMLVKNIAEEVKVTVTVIYDTNLLK
ncbi:MAG: YceI family protein, partial [Bacteroidales bacterium]|nr:YceI family protein [Bacteroidales bacterium]